MKHRYFKTDPQKSILVTSNFPCAAIYINRAKFETDDDNIAGTYDRIFGDVLKKCPIYRESKQWHSIYDMYLRC